MAKESLAQLRRELDIAKRDIVMLTKILTVVGFGTQYLMKRDGAAGADFTFTSSTQLIGPDGSNGNIATKKPSYFPLKTLSVLFDTTFGTKSWRDVV
jgi:hypothetical protein